MLPRPQAERVLSARGLIYIFLRTATKVAVFLWELLPRSQSFLRTATKVAVFFWGLLPRSQCFYQNCYHGRSLFWGLLPRSQSFFEDCYQGRSLFLRTVIKSQCFYENCYHGRSLWLLFYWCLASSTLLATFFQLMITTAVQRNEFNFWYTICLMFPSAKGLTAHIRFPSNLQELKTIIHGRIMQKKCIIASFWL